ncbi:LysR substrate-binding domain-containing protein [Methylomonas rapida]|uniref:LysR substrate-binding domain-containing protein n=1 Tax=Methylomonas rapida TaxID=2963939 RepID=A0ABY7GQI3_9GAMM|nr:LysR substrate-binding domain-containing protein [Methylomonas rapida]WAR46699.1 LysR substrate-binding domain-containing protein [Methylomonas rapida]
MNFNQLELLRYLEETHFNLSKAGEKLNIVQSAASRQVQLLEEELGAPILLRTGKKIHGFTPLGLRVMEEVEQIDLARRNLQTIANDYRDNRTGALHIATTHTQAKYLLPEPIRKFRMQYPQIKIYMVQSSPGEIIDLLHHHKADIAICTEKLDADERLVITPCYDWHHVAIVPKNHPLTLGDIALKRLASFPLLTYSPGYTGYSNIEKAFKAAGLELDVTLAAADSEVIKTYVRLGLGVGIISSTCYEPQNDADLIALDLSHLIARSRTKIAYLKHMYLPSYLQYFIGELLAQSNRSNPEIAA